MITEAMLSSLRDRISFVLGEKRYAHTLGVERCAAELGEVFLPCDEVMALRAAALLHDITKELAVDEQRRILNKMQIKLCNSDKNAVALFHAMTAPYVISKDYPEFALPTVLQAVRVHTTGAEEMSVLDKLLFVADYIEPSRTYPACVGLREFLYSALAEGDQDPLQVLDEAVLRELDHTMMTLLRKGAFLSERTLLARNAILATLSRD